MKGGAEAALSRIGSDLDRMKNAQAPASTREETWFAWIAVTEIEAARRAMNAALEAAEKASRRLADVALFAKAQRRGHDAAEQWSRADLAVMKAMEQRKKAAGTRLTAARRRGDAAAIADLKAAFDIQEEEMKAASDAAQKNAAIRCRIWSHDCR